MRNHLRGAGIIRQCTRCFSLRDQDEAECPTCRRFFDEGVRTVRHLVLNDISTDIFDTDTYGIVSNEQLQGRGTVH